MRLDALAALEAPLHLAPKFFQGTHHPTSQQLDNKSMMRPTYFLDNARSEPVRIVERFK